MTEHPIPFKPWEVRATLDGRKTQTRRALKPQPEIFYTAGWGIARPGRCDMTEIDRMEALAREATPGPWLMTRAVIARDDISVVADDELKKLEADAAFWSAASPTAILALIARLREAEADARRLEWLLHGDHYGLSYSDLTDGRWRHSITWTAYSDCADIRAAIDAAMGEERKV